MILTDKVFLTINNRNIDHLQNIGYVNISINDKVWVFVKDLQKGSNAIIEVKCQNCEKINNIKYIKYNSLVNGYYCRNKECINKARSISVMNKYGVDNVSNLKDIIDKKEIIITEEMKQKSKKTCLEKYGVDNPMKYDLFKTKSKKTCLEKYGVDSPMKLDEVKDKLNQTNLNKYGKEYPLQNEEIMFKMINTNLKKYGTINVFQNEEIKNSIKNTNLKKYGVDNPMKSDEIKDKLKQTILLKYGVENIMELDFFKNKMKNTRIDRGNQIPDELLDDFYIYRRKVDNLTKLNHKYLYSNWDGYDYYDGEYIKNNDISDKKNYPSIDHKISVYYGFINNITVEKISSLENLCITKIKINSSKRNLTEEEYINKKEG
jgi:hypothetical protein